MAAMAHMKKSIATIKHAGLLVALSLLVGVISFAVFKNALQGEFVYDDTYAIVHNPDLYSSQPWIDIFRHDFWGFPLESEKSHKSYRPLTTLTFRFQMRYAGDQADSQAANMMHMFNVLIHALNCGLLPALFCAFGFRLTESVLAALLFACHPVHVEAVASLVGRAELLAALTTILSLILWQLHWPSSLLFASSALLCKETATAVALPLCSCLELFQWMSGKASRPVLKILLPLVLMAALLAARLALHGGLQARPFIHPEANPGAFAADPITRVLTLHYYLFRHLRLLIWPWPLCCDWSYMSIASLASARDLRAMIPLWVIYGLPWCLFKLSREHGAAKGVHRGILISSLWLLMSLLPVSNLLFTVGFTVAERVLYIPSIGSSAILARFLLQLGRQGHSQGHWQGHRQGESLYRSALTANPRNEKLHDLLATRLQNSGGNLEEAIWHAEAAIKLNAGYWHAHATLGQLKLATGSKSLAIEHYKKALLLAERQQLDDVADAPKVRLNLAVMLQDVDVQSAEEHFRRLCTLPSSTQGMAMVIFGAFLESQARGNSSRLAEAATMYESALRAPTGAPESVAHLRLGSVLRKLAKLVGKEPTNPPLEATGAKPTKLQRAKLPERIVSSCSKDSLPLPSLRGSLYQASRCWSKLFRQRSCNLDLDLVRIPGLAPCREAPETFGAGRELLSCLWVAYTEGPSNSEEEFLLSTWQLPATDERSMHHFQQGLKTALAPNSEPLDPGARKWREALAVVGARLTLQGRMEEAKALLQDPRALLPKLATEQLKSGDASVALEAFQAVASLQESAQTHRGLAEAFERLGDKAAAMLHKERAAEFGRTHKSQQKCFLRARCV
ncbi:unnamed protein product [Durusdinium trenchii]|uniref:dolichyl-phosphate-mannose--protein mannosyltransferase n=1 Tax=Durusdinium trenchii TaxID=1381693 RepID=A0ABP0Q3N0_9DINO